MASLTFVTQSCEPKKEINNELAENSKTYDNALDVPVGKLGVIINIDSLGILPTEYQSANSLPYPLFTALKSVLSFTIFSNAVNIVKLLFIDN